MDNFDLKPEPVKVNIKSLVWNILTVVILLASLSVAYLFLTIFINPYTPLNPFPPAMLPTLFVTATPTATPLPQPATWTPTVTLQPLPTRTKAPTWTSLPQMVTESPVPTSPAGTFTPMPASADITYLPSTDFHPDLDCNWMGVAGQVLGTDGKPVQFMEVLLGGTLEGKFLNYFILSGNALEYGLSGFEQVLSDHPIDSTQTIWIQLLDNTAKPLTDRIYIDTFSDCDKNLVMVVFTRNR